MMATVLKKKTVDGKICRLTIRTHRSKVISDDPGFVQQICDNYKNIRFPFGQNLKAQTKTLNRVRKITIKMTLIFYHADDNRLSHLGFFVLPPGQENKPENYRLFNLESFPAGPIDIIDSNVNGLPLNMFLIHPMSMNESEWVIFSKMLEMISYPFS